MFKKITRPGRFLLLSICEVPRIVSSRPIPFRPVPSRSVSRDVVLRAVDRGLSTPEKWIFFHTCARASLYGCSTGRLSRGLSSDLKNLLPPGLCVELDRLHCRTLWNFVSMQRKGIHWRSWNFLIILISHNDEIAINLNFHLHCYRIIIYIYIYIYIYIVA